MGVPLRCGRFAQTLRNAAQRHLTTIGVLLVSSTDHAQPIRALLQGGTTRAAWFGLSAGAAFAISAVGFRNAMGSLAPAHYAVSAALTLVIAQSLQSL